MPETTQPRSTDRARQLIDEGIEQLSTALAQGESDKMRAYLSAMARFHHYSTGNLMLILLQCPAATHVAGYSTWKNLGRHVRRGEKGILILAPVRVKRDHVSTPPIAEATADPDPGEAVVAFRGVHVFDVSQTDGEPLPEFARPDGDPGEYSERLRRLVAQLSIELEYSDDLGSADGVSRGGLIHLRPGMGPAEEFSVLVHELAHELLHHQGDGQSLVDRSTREIQAEAVSYVVSEAVGLDTGTASTDYIQLYRGDAKALLASLEAVRAVATRILRGISGQD